MALRGLGGAAEESIDDGVMAEINITPLVDVFLVLLIIFMVTSSVMSQLGVDVNLPQASQSTAEAQPNGVIVTLLPGGDVKLNQQVFRKDQLDNLGADLKTALDRQGASKLVVLEGDRQAFLGSAIQVMDIARKAGAQKFAIATAPDGK